MTVAPPTVCRDRPLATIRFLVGFVAIASLGAALLATGGGVTSFGLDGRLVTDAPAIFTLAYANLYLLTAAHRRARAVGRALVLGSAIVLCIAPYTGSLAAYTPHVAVAGLSFVCSLFVRAERGLGDVRWPRHTEGAVARSTYALALLLVLAWGAYLIFDGLGRPAFYHDEQFHAATVMSVREAGEFARWNFVTMEPGDPYRRGYLVNAVGALLATLFGYDELTLRFFPALVGFLTIPLVYAFVRRFTDRDVALAVSVAYVSNVIVIFFARFLRPYTVFVFTYLLALYLLDVAIDDYRAGRIRRAGLGFLGVSIALSVSMQAAQFAKIALALVPVALLVYVWYDPSLRRSIRRRPRAAAAIAGAFLASLLIFGAPGEVTALPRQSTNFLSIDKLDNPTTVYVTYLFERYVKFDLAFALLFVVGGATLAVRSVRDRDPRPAVFLLYALAPLFVMLHLFDRFEDPRYMLFLVPFVLTLAMVPLATVIRSATKLIAVPSARVPLLILVVASLVVFPLSPAAPAGGDGYAMKAPAEWEGNDGRTLLHRRAVPPDYETAFGCLNRLVEPGDDVVILGSFETSYLDPHPNVDYYRIPWKSQRATDLRTGEEELFFDLVNETDGLYFLSTYTHLAHGEITSWLVEETVSVSAAIGIERYDYNHYYPEHDLRWPAVRYYGSDSPDTARCR